MAKLTYIAAQGRVRCEITRSETLKHPEPPFDLVSRAEERLKAEVKKGGLAFYILYPERLSESWNLLRQSWETTDANLALTLGAGSPEIDGIFIRENFFKSKGFRLTLETSPERLSKLRFYFVYLTVIKMLREAGSEKEVSPASVHAAFLKASGGIPVENYQIPFKTREKSPAETTCFMFQKDPKNFDLFLTIYNLSGINARIWRDLVEEFKTHVRTGQKKHGSHYRILFSYIRHRIQAANRGPERMGLDLPMPLLAASYIHPEQVKRQPLMISELPSEEDTIEFEILSETDPAPRKKSGLLSSVLGGLFTAKRPDSAPPYQLREAGAEDSARKKHRTSLSEIQRKESLVLARGDEGKDAPEAPVPKPFPLKVSISEDGMTAKISGFREETYQKEWKVDEQEILKIFKAQGLVFGTSPEHLKMLRQKISTKENLNGLMVAEGRPPVQAANPFLKHSYLKMATEADLQKKQVNVRETQEKAYVHTGNLISVIGFNDPGESGMTVRGKEIEPLLPSDIQRFKAGEGTELRGLEFYATSDGIPDISGDVVSLSKAYRHAGDVNLSSGNLTYDGDVIIQGSVDVGAKVFVAGDLIIEGEILEAEVYVRGNLEVKGGILGKEKTRITVKGNLSLNFAEHCTIWVGGDCIINRSVINCHLWCRGAIKPAGSESALIGGLIRCSRGIEINYLGKERSDITDVACGVDWISEKRLELRKNRIKKLNQEIRQLSAELNKLESTSFKGEEMQKSTTEKKGSLTRKLKKMQDLAPALKEHLEKAGKVSHDEGAQILVHTEMSPNLKLRIADLSFPVPGKYSQVLVHYKVRGGTHFSSPDSEPKSSKTG